MRGFTKVQKCLALLIFSSLAAGVDSCDNTQDIQNWIENTAKLKTTAEEQAAITPYRQPQFKALKAYFGELNQMTLALRNDVILKERFNLAISQEDINALCGKVLITKALWQTITERCSRNNFFLCAEEVRAYQDVINLLRASLNSPLRTKFDQSPLCAQ